MKKNIYNITSIAICLIVFCMSCSKKKELEARKLKCSSASTTPTTTGGGGGGVITGPNNSTCSYTVNNTTVYAADSVNWDVYSASYNRIKGFKNGLQVFTIWLTSTSSQNTSLVANTLYWYDGLTTSTNLYNVSSGNIALTNNNSLLDATVNGTGNKQSGSGASTSTISIAFSNAIKR